MYWLSRRKSVIVALVFAFSSILGATPRLVLSTSSIGPIYVTPGTNGPVQSLVASNGGDGILSISTSTSASWLAASIGTQAACAAPLTGICYPISIALNTASLTPGSHTEYVTVMSPATIDAPTQVPVNVIVANIPGSLTLYVTPNGGTASVNIYPHTAIASSITTQTGGSWLTIGAPTGTTTFGTPYAITGTSQTGQAAGTYTGTVSITGGAFPADNQIVNVTLDVTTSPIIQVKNQNVLLVGYATGPQVTSVISFSNIGMGTLTISSASITPVGSSTASPTNNIFSLNVTSPNSITVMANPSQVAPGLYTANVTLASNAANSGQVSIPVELTVSEAGVPSIYQSGIVNIATFLPDTLAQGDIVSVWGDQFTPVGPNFTNPLNPINQTGNSRLATALGNAQVLVNGVPAPLYFVSRQQINFQMPYEAIPGQVTTVQVVANGVNGNIRSVQVAAAAPRILAWPLSMVPGNYGVVVNEDNTDSLPAPGIGNSRLSKPGDSVVIYCVGLGQTTPSAATGAAVSSTSLLTTPTNAVVTFGSGANAVQTQAFFTGLTPTAVGLYQVNVTLPANVPTGNSVPLQLSVGGLSSNAVNMPIL